MWSDVWWKFLVLFLFEFWILGTMPVASGQWTSLNIYSWDFFIQQPQQFDVWLCGSTQIPNSLVVVNCHLTLNSKQLTRNYKLEPRRYLTLGIWHDRKRCWCDKWRKWMLFFVIFFFYTFFYFFVVCCELWDRRQNHGMKWSKLNRLFGFKLRVWTVLKLKAQSSRLKTQKSEIKTKSSVKFTRWLKLAGVARVMCVVVVLVCPLFMFMFVFVILSCGKKVKVVIGFPFSIKFFTFHSFSTPFQDVRCKIKHGPQSTSSSTF